MKQERKPKTYMTPMLFEKVKEIYRKKGYCPESIQEVVREVGISRASAEKYLIEARKVIANRDDEKKEDDRLRAEFKNLEAENAVLKEKLENSNARWMNEFQVTKTKHANEVNAYQAKLNQLTIDNTKLQAKVEVLHDLMKEKR